MLNKWKKRHSNVVCCTKYTQNKYKISKRFDKLKSTVLFLEQWIKVKEEDFSEEMAYHSVRRPMPSFRPEISSSEKCFDDFEMHRKSVKRLHIPEFRGGLAPFEISVEMFVEIVDSLKSTYGWSDDVTAEKVFNKLHGEAARWRWTTYYEVTNIYFEPLLKFRLQKII